MNFPTDDVGVGGGRADGELYETEIGDRTPSEAVVDAVSAIRDREPATLPPLYETIDPDALDELCSSADPDSRPMIRFDYQGLVVTVRVPDVISVFEP